MAEVIKIFGKKIYVQVLKALRGLKIGTGGGVHGSYA
jgi:hypothetical protein